MILGIREERQIAITRAAGVAAHALLTVFGGGSRTAQQIATKSFDYAEAFVNEAERRAKAAGFEI